MQLSQDDINALLSDSGSDEPPPPPPPAQAAYKVPDGQDPHRVMDLSVPIIVKLAERDLSIRSIVGITVGSILEFDTSADAELTMMVNNQPVARGQAVKIGENFGFRVTKIGGMKERIRAMAGF